VPIKAITFDCAQTLVDVAWNPEFSLCQAARFIGLNLPQGAELSYSALYKSRFPQFLQMNLTRSAVEARKFHERLSRDWLAEIGLDPERASELTSAAEHLIFGPDSTVFRVYSETVEALRSLRANNFVLGVVSNWDYSLHRVLDMFGLTRFISAAVASLEEGVEKPDPKLFEIALAKLGCRPEETLHIGDDPIDDIEGARNSGIRALLIDRTRAANIPGRLSSLLQVPEAIACLD
jgi:putative hydrolase of the HAD superfamily